MTSNNNTPIVLLTPKEDEEERENNLQLPQLGSDNLFQRARRIRFNKGYKKIMSLPRIKDNDEIISSYSKNKAKENKDKSNHNFKHNLKIFNLHLIQKQKQNSQNIRNEIMLKPIESLSLIKKQLVHITIKSLSSEEKNTNYLLKGNIIKKRNKPNELSSFRIYSTDKF